MGLIPVAELQNCSTNINSPTVKSNLSVGERAAFGLSRRSIFSRSKPIFESGTNFSNLRIRARGLKFFVVWQILRSVKFFSRLGLAPIVAHSGNAEAKGFNLSFGTPFVQFFCKFFVIVCVNYSFAVEFNGK